MMATRTKFGAFGGVFTPAILTILGVIMYLRLPNIIGNAGLFFAIGIILVAHVISVTTGLSVSSIATDKRVKAGGSYYIISRSLGLPIGGTLGLALFVGLSFGVSLYLIGFAESLLTYFDIAIDPTTGKPDVNMIRLVGSVTLLCVTIVTFISTSLAIKTQYFIMSAIVLSLLSILIGNSDRPAPELASLDPMADGIPLVVLFGIFFPAVTGFEAGVSMSGDLKDPKRDIPRGTLWAIGVGLVVYIALSTFLAFRIPTDQLAGNPSVLIDYAWIPQLVIAGVWGATISSALGSILGAPRILQACALDRIGPKLFGRGVGPSNEPRNALLLTFVIALSGILIGSLEAIAEIVSMFFLASYGVLNLACAVESWASPDFRPDFRIPRTVSVIGAVACLILMVQLNMVAMFGSFALMALVYVWLKRKELALEGGDTWSGVWSTVVRSGLERLSREQTHARNWRPNIVLFTRRSSARAPLIRLAHGLTQANGVLTEFALKRDRPTTIDLAATPVELPSGVFSRELAADGAPFANMAAVCRYHGITGLEPNTAMLDWSTVGADPDGAAGFFDTLDDLGFNSVTVAGADRLPASGTRLDVWWRGSSRNLALGLAWVRMLTTTEGWRQASVRFLASPQDAAVRRRLEQRLAAWLKDARVNAELVVTQSAPRDLSAADWIARHSADADLILVGLEGDETTDPSDPLDEMHGLAALATSRTVAMLKATQDFHDPLPTVDLKATDAAIATDSDVWRDKPDTLRLSDDKGIASRTLSAYAGVAEAMRSFTADVIAPPIAELDSVLEDVSALAKRALSQLERSSTTPQLPRRRRLVVRIEEGLVRGVLDELSGLQEWITNEQAASLRDGLAAVAARLGQARDETDEFVHLGESPRGKAYQLALRRHLSARLDTEGSAALGTTLERLHALLQELFRNAEGVIDWMMTTVETDAAALAATVDVELTPTDRDAFDERIAAWRERAAQVVSEVNGVLASYARDTAQALADVLNSDGGAPTPPPRSRSRTTGDPGLDVDPLHEVHGPRFALQAHWVKRTQLDVTLRGVHLRLRALAAQVQLELTQSVRHGVGAELTSFVDELTELSADLAEGKPGKAELAPRLSARFDDDLVIGRMLEAIDGELAALPEQLETLSEPSFDALADGRFDELEEVTIAVRRLVAFILKSDVVGRLREALAGVEQTTRRAASGARDVARLVSYDIDAGGDGAELDGDLALNDERRELVESGIERCRNDIATVERELKAAESLLFSLVDDAIARTRGHAIGSAAEKLDRFIRTQERRGVRQVARDLVERSREQVRRAMVDLSYRWSRGVLLARRLKRADDEPASPVERLIELHRASTPSEQIRQSLPVFYRQVFLGRAAADPAYWVSQSDELEVAERAVVSHRNGHPGALWITGRPGSGMSAVTQRILATHFDDTRIVHVRPPDGGSVDVAMFDRALLAGLGARGAVDSALDGLPDGSVVVIHDLELWWERSPSGLGVVRHLDGLLERHGGRTLFVIVTNEYVMRLLRRLDVLVNQALATVHCRPLEALRLREAILTRHEATGATLRIAAGGQRESLAPTEWRLAKLFGDLFDYSDGYIGAALHGWISHIAEASSDEIVVARALVPDTAVFKTLEPQWTALLIELVMHRRVTTARLARITGVDEPLVTANLSALTRTGLVVFHEASGAYEIDRFVLHHVTRWLHAEEVL